MKTKKEISPADRRSSSSAARAHEAKPSAASASGKTARARGAKSTGSSAPTGPTLLRHTELLAGARRRAEYIRENTAERDLFDRIAGGQQPEYLIVCCSDSRVSPPSVFDMQPGRIFEHQNMGNIVTRHDVKTVSRDDSIEATIRYALTRLKVKHIVILGHTGCGLVKAVIDQARQPIARRLPARAGSKASPTRNEVAADDPIARWMAHAGDLMARVQRHYDKLSPDQEDLAAVAENVLAQVERIRSYPDVREALKSGQLEDIIGCVFEVNNHGVVSNYDDQQQRFVPVSGTSTVLPERQAERSLVEADVAGGPSGARATTSAGSRKRPSAAEEASPLALKRTRKL